MTSTDALPHPCAVEGPYDRGTFDQVPLQRASFERGLLDRPFEAQSEDAGEDTAFDPVRVAVERIAAGSAVVVVDDASREDEGDIVFAAELATAELVAFAMTQCRGLLCAPMAGADLDRLELEQMVTRNTEHHGTAFTVSVDAAAGISTGISAADRALTLRLLADPATEAGDLVRPGHVFPLRADDGGVLARAGHTEAGVELCRLAGLRPAAAICEIANTDGTMARLPQLRAFAHRHNLALISVACLAEYLQKTSTASTAA